MYVAHYVARLLGRLVVVGVDLVGDAAVIVVVVAHAILLLLVALAVGSGELLEGPRVAVLTQVANRARVGRVAVGRQILVALHLLLVFHATVWMQMLLALAGSTYSNEQTKINTKINAQ